MFRSSKPEPRHQGRAGRGQNNLTRAVWGSSKRAFEGRAAGSSWSLVSCPERTEEEESPHSGGSGRVLRRLRLCVRGSEPEEEAGTKPTCAPPTPPCSASTRYRQQRLQQPPPLLVHQDADAQSPPWRASESGTTVGERSAPAGRINTALLRWSSCHRCRWGLPSPWHRYSPS